MRLGWKLLLPAFVFALCAAPAIVSYQPYAYQWDDSVYLGQSVAANKAFWSGDRHAFRMAIEDFGTHPPVMALLGLPWGPFASWDAAGKSFVSLEALTAFFVACCLFLMLRSGLDPLFLVIGSVGLLAAMGPFPAGADVVQIGGPRSGVHYANIHAVATGFMVDSLFAWIAFAAILLIPYEIASNRSSTADGRARDILRGVLWAAIFSAGAITKVNFFYFIALVVPILLVLRARNRGLRNASVALLSFAICSLPVAFYWLRYGQTALRFAVAATAGHDASFYYSALLSFLSRTVRLSPGLLLTATLLLGEIVYLVVKRREVKWGANALALMVLLGYGMVALASNNREIRFLFPVIIALPFLIGIVLSGKTACYPQKAALLTAALVFCCLAAAAVPVLHRAERSSVQRSEAVLAQATQLNAKHILLATDSPTLNYNLMILAMELAPSRPPVDVDYLARRVVADSPIEDDFRAIQESDMVVFQKKEALSPPFTNARFSEYGQFAQQEAAGAPIKVMDDLSIYRMPPLSSITSLGSNTEVAIR